MPTPSLSPDQEKALWDKRQLNMDSSKGLSRAVIFYLIKCFAVWQGKELRQLETSHVTFDKDEMGLFVSVNLESISTTTTTNHLRKVVKRYDDPANPRSVYKIFKKYRSYVANEGPFLVRPICSIKDFICYSPLPLGVNVITGTVLTLMKDAGLECTYYGNYSLNLQAVHVLLRFGTGSHCLSSWLLAKGLKGMPPAPKCGLTNCEEANPEMSLMFSRLLDAPFPADAVEILQKIEIKQEIDTQKTDENFHSWMCNLTTSKKRKKGVGTKRMEASRKCHVNERSKKKDPVILVDLNDKSTRLSKNNSSFSSSKSNLSSSANSKKNDNQDIDLRISSVSSISESAFDAQIVGDCRKEMNSIDVTNRKRNITQQSQSQVCASSKMLKKYNSDAESKIIDRICDGKSASSRKLAKVSRRKKTNSNSCSIDCNGFQNLKCNYIANSRGEKEVQEINSNSKSEYVDNVNATDCNGDGDSFVRLKNETVDKFEESIEGNETRIVEVSDMNIVDGCLSPDSNFNEKENVAENLSLNVTTVTTGESVVSRENENGSHTNHDCITSDNCPSSISEEIIVCKEENREDLTIDLSPIVSSPHKADSYGLDTYGDIQKNSNIITNAVTIQHGATKQPTTPSQSSLSLSSSSNLIHCLKSGNKCIRTFLTSSDMDSAAELPAESQNESILNSIKQEIIPIAERAEILRDSGHELTSLSTDTSLNCAEKVNCISSSQLLCDTSACNDNTTATTAVSLSTKTLISSSFSDHCTQLSTALTTSMSDFQSVGKDKEQNPQQRLLSPSCQENSPLTGCVVTTVSSSPTPLLTALLSSTASTCPNIGVHKSSLCSCRSSSHHCPDKAGCSHDSISLTGAESAASDFPVQLILNHSSPLLIHSSQPQAAMSSPSSLSSSSPSTASHCNTATFLTKYDKSANTIFRTLKIFDDPKAKKGICSHNFADIPTICTTKEKTNNCVVTSDCQCSDGGDENVSTDLTNLEQLVDATKDKSVRKRMTSAINLGDYFAPGTLIPASCINILTQQGENGPEVVMKFGFNQRESS